jgi:hypothetical protein
VLRETYVDLYGRSISLKSLDADERGLVASLRRRAATNPAWHEFRNLSVKALAQFYEPRGVSRRKVVSTPVWRIAADLTGRLGIKQGVMRAPDYRDELEHLIATRFKSRRAFCEATGLSEDMLSHVLARRKDLSIQTLAKALAKIGCLIHIVPAPAPAPIKARKRAAG